MLFNSLQFIFLFLPLVLGLSLRLKGNSLIAWLSLSSFVFYAFAGHVWFLIPMLVTTVLDFLLAQWIFKTTNQARRKRILLISLVGNLGMLFFFKYSMLVATTVSDTLVFLVPGVHGEYFARFVSAFEVILPAGISFYTFQTLSYIVDVYRGHAEPERNFWRFACFVSFFPHLVAGPITRHNQLIPQLRRIEGTGISPLWRQGIFLFAIGFCKKVLIADRIAHFIDPMLASTPSLTLVTAWICALGYTLQIYFDFSGYSDMAIGLARLFNIELPQNFNSPYRAMSPVDFWRRWHMTLSAWLRDYLYISMGGNRCSPFRKNFNLMMTMFLGGLWHGANWTFAAWGVYHGALLILFHKFERPWSKVPIFFQRAATFLLIAVGWVFFRSPSFAQAGDWLASLAGYHGIGLRSLGNGNEKLILLICAGIFVTQKFENASHFTKLHLLGRPQQVALGGAFALAVLYLSESSRFLYFQF